MAGLIVASAALIVLGFFMPWFQGDGMLAMRSFSGFGLARDLHTLTRSMETVKGGTLSPLLFYIAPAGAVGVAIYAVLTGMAAGSRLLAAATGIYTIALVAATLVLALTSVTDANRLLGTPAWGLAPTALGAALMLASVLLRRPSERD